jgi:hypothetical protein
MTEADAPLLGRAELERAFTLLGERLARRGVVADIYVVRGAAIALAYDAKRVTRDVDALYLPHHPGLRVAAASPRHIFAMKALAARERDLPDLRLLAEIAGIGSPAAVLTCVVDFFRDEVMSERARRVLAELFAD